MGTGGGFRRLSALCAAVLALGVAPVALGLAGAPTADAALAPAEALTYLPAGFVHAEHSAALREETLAQMQAYGIGQMLLPLPDFRSDGSERLKKKETAPATAGRWSPHELAEVTPLLGQVDPLLYDSERKAAAAYERWVREGLAYYSAHTAAGTRIVPDLPSYGPNRWHDPAVENIGTASTAVEEGLAEGDRVNGAGVFWWWGFYYDEEAAAYNGAPDREAWLTHTRLVSFTP